MARRFFINYNPPAIDADICNAWQNHVHDGIDADGHADKIDAVNHVDWGEGASIEDIPDDHPDAAPDEQTLAIRGRGLFAKAMRTLALFADEIATNFVYAQTLCADLLRTDRVEANSVQAETGRFTQDLTAEQVIATNTPVALATLEFDAGEYFITWVFRHQSMTFNNGTFSAPQAVARYAMVFPTGTYTILPSEGAQQMTLPYATRSEGPSDTYQWTVNKGSYGGLGTAFSLQVIFF